MEWERGGREIPGQLSNVGAEQAGSVESLL